MIKKILFRLSFFTVLGVTHGATQTYIPSTSTYHNYVINIESGTVNKLYIGSGTASAPGISFSIDTNSGIRLVGQDQPSLVAGAVDKFYVDSAGGLISAAPYIQNSSAPASDPSYSFFSDPNSGFTLVGTSQPVIAANGINRISVDINGQVVLSPKTALFIDSDNPTVTNPGFRTIQFGAGSVLWGSTQGYVVGQQIHETCYTNNYTIDTSEYSRYISDGPAETMCMTTGGDISFSADPTGTAGAEIDPIDHEPTVRWVFRNAGVFEVAKSTRQFLIGPIGGNQYTVNFTTLAASVEIRIDDPGAGSAASFILSKGTQTVNDPLAILGTRTNNNAAAGYIGEYVSSITAAATDFPTSGQWGDLVSMSFTAGDWDVTAIFYAQAVGATVTDVAMGISQTAGNSNAGLVPGDNQVEPLPPVSTSNSFSTIPNYRVSLSGTTTLYFKYLSDYSIATPKARGRLSARRVR